MKIKKEIVGLIVLILIGGAIFLLIKDNDTEKINDAGDKDSKDTTKVYYEKGAVIEEDDGWYQTFLMTTYNLDFDNINHYYNACNIKYERLEGYNILVYDENGNIYQRIPTNPSLLVSERKKDGVYEGDEVEMVDKYFNEKKFGKKITNMDLNDIDLKLLDKEKIVNIYNKVYDVEFSKNISNFYLPDCSVQKDKSKNGYTLNIGVINSRPEMLAIRFDILYDNGVYLSDLIKNNNASASQKELYDNFSEMSSYIIDNQTVNIRNAFKYNGEVYERIYDLIETFTEVKN